MFVFEADHAGRGARALFRLEQGEEIPGFFFTEDLGDSTGANGAGPNDERTVPTQQFGLARMSAFGGKADIPTPLSWPSIRPFNRKSPPQATQRLRRRPRHRHCRGRRKPRRLRRTHGSCRHHHIARPCLTLLIPTECLSTNGHKRASKYLLEFRVIPNCTCPMRTRCLLGILDI